MQTPSFASLVTSLTVSFARLALLRVELRRTGLGRRDRPAVDRPALDRPAVDRPAVDHPAVDRHALGRRVVDRPAVDRPAVDRPAVDRPAVDRPALGHLVRLAPVALVAFVALAASATACAPDSADPIAVPDASPPPRALDPAGTYALESRYSLAAPPPDLAPLLAELAIATDGADDPTAYLVDLVVDSLPEGNARTVASVLAPYVATELHDRIASYAPELAPALRAMALGATRISTRFSTLESLVVTGTAMDQDVVARGRASRTIRGVRVDNTEIAFSSIGLVDQSVDAELAVELVGTATRAEEPRVLSNRVVIARHAVALPIGAWFRAAFDRAVVPAVVPGATDLATAFRTLVDCPRLGGLIAEAVGIGSSALYTQACGIGIGVAARKIYERFPAASAPAHELAVMGVARAMDRDGDGVMDAIDAGVWTGTLGDVSVGTSVFEGTSR